ncbi:hypothetical protein SAMN04490243_0972 [Robiginitalea myxolifaciens]|uniref:Uncharacterized protein n=1 Tax=Robiginitalea myxolifaciens TaxID=400055 RepID=A0A1I6FZF3_9FLAO|nr:hypothetical protein [Robiginitalea myxolifaciens]SFR35319.1 hypothetical protein SAMN04490243_0972 [Robiginitalea myxolifaciens]
MNQIESYMYLMGTYAALYALAFIIYQRFKSRISEDSSADNALANQQGE